MCAGKSRRNKHQRSRTEAARKRARRASILSKVNRKAKRLAVTGVNPVQNYGNTVMGIAKSQVAKHRTNVAMATGDHSPGTCVTALLRWHFPKTKYYADPARGMLAQQYEMWMRVWDQYQLKQPQMTSMASSPAKNENSQKQMGICHRAHLRDCRNAIRYWHQSNAPHYVASASKPS